MKGTITTGIWLIFLGVVALLDNFNIIDFNFYALLRYWPLLIISVGLNLIFQYRNFGTAIIIGANLVICTFLIYVGYTSNDSFNWAGKVSYTSNLKDSKDLHDKTLVIPLVDSVSNPVLSLNFGASTIKIDSNSSQFLEAVSLSNNMRFSLERDNDEIDISGVIKDKNVKDNFVNLSLNKDFIWKLEFNIGASRFNADLSQHKISGLELNAGAADLKLKLGQPIATETDIEINTAASSCTIQLPKDAACAIEMSTILSSNKLDGFVKKEDQWETENYRTATKRYKIEFNGAANSLKIERY